jgi:hypothetical protein
MTRNFFIPRNFPVRSGILFTHRDSAGITEDRPAMDLKNRKPFQAYPFDAKWTNNAPSVFD